MGYILYTKNGTFTPADYGLNIGDTITVLAIGGGAGGGGGAYGSGSNANTPGSPGGTTSFGTLLSCPGGTCGTRTTTNPFIGGQPAYELSRYKYEGSSSQLQIWEVYKYVGGIGATGFYPGICMPKAAEPQRVLQGDYTGVVFADFNNENRVAERPFGGPASVCVYRGGNYTTYNSIGAPGGLGYGAGGGGAVYYDINNSNYITVQPGGGAGMFKQLVHTLTSTNAIAVTIGVGGNGYLGTHTGGAGADGCVAIFW